MGHKINPISFRFGINKTWNSKWFANRREFADLFLADIELRKAINLKLTTADVTKIEIERSAKKVTVNVYAAKPGMIIGKGGVGIEELKKQIKNALKIKTEFKITIEESKNINIEAQVWASTLAEQIEKRMSFRRIVKNALEQIMDAGALGVKIAVSGRLGGAEIARTEWLYRGKLPLHTLRANIDFARATAFTTYGTVGVKVWINKGEVFGNGKVVSNKL